MDERTKAVIEAAREWHLCQSLPVTLENCQRENRAYAALEAAVDALDQGESAPKSGNCPHCNEQPYNIRNGICGWCDKSIEPSAYCCNAWHYDGKSHNIDCVRAKPTPTAPGKCRTCGQPTDGHEFCKDHAPARTVPGVTDAKAGE